MDAEELLKVTGVTHPLPSAANGVAPLSCADDCVPSRCRPACALEVTAELLGAPGISGQAADLLLDLHLLLKTRQDPETALRIFCLLRQRLEGRHYLSFYRLRRWLENQVIVAVRPTPGAEAFHVPLVLKHYCVEAVRRLCLCTALQRGIVLKAPRLNFQFRPFVAAPGTPTNV